MKKQIGEFTIPGSKDIIYVFDDFTYRVSTYAATEGPSSFRIEENGDVFYKHYNMDRWQETLHHESFFSTGIKQVMNNFLNKAFEEEVLNAGDKESTQSDKLEG